MATSPDTDLRRCVVELERHGLLLQSDLSLPSITTIVEGEPIRGSWWGHSRGDAIYRVANALVDDRDVLLTKLVDGKVTYVHRRLWAAVFAVACSRERWQLDRLPQLAQKMLDTVDKLGELHTTDVPWTGGMKPGDAARQLERRLLVHSDEVHTASGAHAKRLERWDRWAARVWPSARSAPPDEGKKALNDLVANLNAIFGGYARLPWAERRVEAAKSVQT